MPGKTFAVFCSTIILTAIILKMTFISFPNTVLYGYSCLASVILFLLIASFTYSCSRYLFCDERIELDKKAVLITGCDSGFGNMLAKRLDAKGFQVFASCLFPEGKGAKELKEICSDSLHILYMDVTKQDTVEKAVRYVEQNLGCNVLWAVVNNAGILKGFTVDFTSMQAFKDTMEVNAFGQVRVTKAFLPLLKKSKGRVVNVTSLAGRLSKFGSCAYTMSKHAAKAFTECLSQDLNVWGVRVIAIEPEIFRTPLSSEENTAKRIDAEFSNISEDILTSYGEEYLTEVRKCILKVARSAPPNSYKVVDDIELALTHKYPNHVYKPRRNIISRILWNFAECIPYGFYENFVLLFVKLLEFPVPKEARNNISY